MLKKHAIKIFFLYLFAAPATANCQNFPIQQFTTENGLPSNTVSSVYRDSKGFLWMSTNKGIVRYNGMEFETFTIEDGLPANDAFFFLEDHEGRLWISNYEGELCFYKDGIFHTRANTPFLKKAPHYSFITWMTLEKDSSVTITFKDWLAFINVKGDKCSSYPIKKGTLPDTSDMLAISKISENRYCLTNTDHTYIIDTAGNYQPNTLQPNKGHFNNNCYAQGDWHYCSGSGIYSSDQALQMRFEGPLSSAYIFNLYNDKNNWFTCTIDGLFINNSTQVLKGKKVSGITQDIEGNYWVSTWNDGVFCFGKDYAGIEEYDNVYTGDLKSIRTLGKYIFFTTANGNLYRFENGKTDTLFDYFRHFGYYYKNKGEWEHHVAENSFGHGVDPDYRYYNIEGNFSFIIDSIGGVRPTMKPLKKDSAYNYNNIMGIFCGKRFIYIRSSHYLSFIDKQDIEAGKPLLIKKIGNNKSGMQLFPGLAIAPDNSLWYSGADGINKITDTVSALQEQLGRSTFTWMQIAGNNLVGITPGNQLLVYHNFESKNVRTDTVPSGGIVWSRLFKLNDSTIIATTNNLYRVLQLHDGNNLPAYDIRVVENKSLPLDADPIYRVDSFCYFFKRGTITRVPVNALYIKVRPPGIVFKTLKTRSKSYPVQPGIVVSYDESKNMSIQFTSLSFGSKYIICEYSISKGETDYWLPVSNNEINLFNPPFGNYTVKVRARTLSGSFSEPYLFKFTILKPFWAAWWFIALCLLSCIGLVIGLFRLIVSRNTRKRILAHENEIKFLRSEYKALNALMNPHFIFNTLNNVQWLVNNDDKITANRYLRVFADLVRQNMNNVSKELIPLSNELELVSNYLKLEKLRFKDALNYDINISEGSDLDNIEIPPLLIQPLVENAIKHGLLPGITENNLLTINVYRESNNLCIDVIDNGIGFNESQKKARHFHKSTGIENIRKRIEKLRLMHDINISLSISQLTNSADQPAGTIARICIDITDD